MAGNFINLASSIGILKGIYLGIPRNKNLPKKLLINNFFNSVGKETSRFGQAAAAASLLIKFIYKYRFTILFCWIYNEPFF